MVSQVLIFYLKDHGFFDWWNHHTDPSSLYADDTSIIVDSEKQIPKIIQAIQFVGRFTGLELNLSKMIAFSCKEQVQYTLAGVQIACSFVEMQALLGLILPGLTLVLKFHLNFLWD